LLGLVAILSKNRDRITDQVRYFNKHVFNRIAMRFAGKPRSPFAIVYHVGRRSGNPYRTPIIVEPVSGGFVFALTYGPQVDWYRNIQAAGECILRWRGKDYRLLSPETIDARTALPAFPAPARVILRLVGIEHFFWMRIR
jgi:deazaflavin-dependent oxidoreductase (nitroreductase family)